MVVGDGTARGCRAGLILVWVTAMGSVAAAREVWQARFESDADGVVDIFDGNSGKSMIGSVAEGGLTLDVWDNDTDAYTPDKAGRPLGYTLGGADSFSGLYRFRWSALSASSTHAWEAVGFLGSTASGGAQTRQILGSLLRHWKVGENGYIRVGLGLGATAGFGYSAGVSTNLGPNALLQEYQLAIGYDGPTTTLTVGLYDAAGNLLTGQSADLTVLNSEPGQVAALVVDHLGWSDYSSPAVGDLATVWQLNSLHFYDTASGAADTAAGIAPPTGACCHGDGTCSELVSESVCQAMPGYWQGASTSCATAGCTPFDPDAEPWDALFTGVDTAADHVPNFLRWDNPIDDDWDEPGTSYQVNTPEPGFLTVDRVTDPADHFKTGNMWIRDPVLSNAVGITLEVRVRIEPSSMLDSFSITYLDEAGSWGVHLSPDRIKAGALAQGGSGNVAMFDTTDDFHLYRVVMPGNALHFAVYVDNNPLPIVTGTGTGAYPVGSADRLTYPRVLVGDNSNNSIYNAHYVLDFIRYRRGATAPGETPGALPDRVFPLLPPPADGSESWAPGFEGDALPTLPDWVPGGSISRWALHGDGTIELNTLAGGANARKDAPAGWPNLGAVTIEARVKVYSDSQDGAFNLWANDTLGGTSLNLSPDKAELSHGGKPAGRAPYFMDTTDGFHVYRIVRGALEPFANPVRLGREMYWHLFIDDDPVPAVTYQHCVGWSLDYSRIVFGDFAYPIPGNGCHVLIDSIRWHEGASAPPRFADMDRDGDVDLRDFAVHQGCSGGEGAGNCAAADLDASGLVDLEDFETCSSCLAGPNEAPPPGCAR